MKTLLCVFGIAIGGLLTQTAFGCSCPTVGQSGPSVIDPVTVRQNLRRYYLNEFRGALFTGTVTKIEIVGGEWKKKVTVEVDKHWLGITDPVTVIFTGLNGADCGVDFQIGQKYLITSRLFDGQLISGLCDNKSKDSKLPDGTAAARLEEILGTPKRFSQKPKN